MKTMFFCSMDYVPKNNTKRHMRYCEFTYVTAKGGFQLQATLATIVIRMTASPMDTSCNSRHKYFQQNEHTGHALLKCLLNIQIASVTRRNSCDFLLELKLSFVSLYYLKYISSKMEILLLDRNSKISACCKYERLEIILRIHNSIYLYEVYKPSCCITPDFNRNFLRC